MPKNSTQDFIPIKNVREGLAILDNGNMRGILMASSINFALKSDDERKAILLQFQDFLNSLDFQVQIIIQSRRLDIRPYIATLEGRKKAQTNDLMKLQIEQYIEFVRSFTESSNIMTKNFFVVVPYDSAVLNVKSGGLGGLFSFGAKADTKEADNLDFEEKRNQLEQRMDTVEQGLVRCGIRIARLGTEEVVELFYKILNPGETEKPMKVT